MSVELPASSVRLPAGPWITVIAFLCERFPDIKGDEWRDRFLRGRVRDESGQPLSLDTVYRQGSLVRYFREVADELVIPFEERILFADKNLIVVDKPHFLTVSPVGVWVEQTLLSRLIRRTGNRDLSPIHRIDRATAGLVLFSVSPQTRAPYQALFRERRISKAYEALAPPLPELRFPVARRTRLTTGTPFFRTAEVAGPANSETRIEVIDRGRDAWRYRLIPVSGRKHQLRVHMAALGAPILNDPLYPDIREEARGDFSRPLALLASRLEFTDPLDGSARQFSSTLVLGEAI